MATKKKVKATTTIKEATGEDITAEDIQEGVDTLEADITAATEFLKAMGYVVLPKGSTEKFNTRPKTDGSNEAGIANARRIAAKAMKNAKRNGG